MKCNVLQKYSYQQCRTIQTVCMTDIIMYFCVQVQKLPVTVSDQENFYKSLGQRIREARQKNKFTQDDFANRLDLSRASIVNIEKGRQHPPIHSLWNIAKLLNLEIADLLPSTKTEQTLSEGWKKIVSKKPIKEKTQVLRFIEEVEFQKRRTNEKS